MTQTRSRSKRRRKNLKQHRRIARKKNPFRLALTLRAPVSKTFLVSYSLRQLADNVLVLHLALVMKLNHLPQPANISSAFSVGVVAKCRRLKKNTMPPSLS